MEQESLHCSEPQPEPGTRGIGHWFSFERRVFVVFRAAKATPFCASFAEQKATRLVPDPFSKTDVTLNRRVDKALAAKYDFGHEYCLFKTEQSSLASHDQTSTRDRR